MKKPLFPLVCTALSMASFCTIAHGGPQATVAGSWVELRKGPLFAASVQTLAPTWGPSLGVGTLFQIEKTYGRWIYGTPIPPRNMKKGDRAFAGWIYSRMLLPSGDEPLQSRAEQKEIFTTSFYATQAWNKMSLRRDEESLLYFNFLESAVLSKKSLAVFRQQDEAVQVSDFSLFPTANAAEDGKSLGLIGADLDFLKQEFKQVEAAKAKEKQKKQAKVLRPPGVPPATDAIKTNILGRYLAYRSLKLPALSHEEVDGSLYMQAIVRRVLDSCPSDLQKPWKDKRWHVFRFLRLNSETLPQNSWLQFELPGAYFGVSAKAIDLASNEAEMAFLLSRPLLRSGRIKKEKILFSAKNWHQELVTKAPDTWEKIQRQQSIKLSENLDVGDEVAVDIATMECMAHAGYNPDSGIHYLKKLSAANDQAWSKWFHENQIGLDYRIERTAKLLREEKAKGLIANATILNKKRFQKAVELWNHLP